MTPPVLENTWSRIWAAVWPTFSEIGLSGVADIILMSMILYGAFLWFKRRRAFFVLVGIGIVGLVYLIAHQFFKGSARGILAISMLGNVVVSLAWFGPQLGGLHQYGTHDQSVLLTAIVAHLTFFALGYCPAGWLRLRKCS